MDDDELVPLEDSREDTPGTADVEVSVLTLRRVGIAMQYLGGVGVAVWAIETYTTWDSLRGATSMDGGGWTRDVAFILGQFGTLLIAALVVGLGTACRLFADWTSFRLSEWHGTPAISQGGVRSENRGGQS